MYVVASEVSDILGCRGELVTAKNRLVLLLRETFGFTVSLKCGFVISWIRLCPWRAQLGLYEYVLFFIREYEREKYDSYLMLCQLLLRLKIRRRS